MVYTEQINQNLLQDVRSKENNNNSLFMTLTLQRHVSQQCLTYK